jgi:mono/diheme cytochrome c family protein
MRKPVQTLTLFAVLGLAGFLAATSPAVQALMRGGSPAAPAEPPDLANGQTMFNIGGCASCHATPKQDDKTRLGGGLALHSPFGAFHVPNISPHAQDGIGGWSVAQFIRAMHEGVAPDGSHYYPAFPYASYQRMTGKDLADMFAFIHTLPQVEGKARGHELGFPFSIRRTVGGWKLLNLDGAVFAPDPSKSAEWNRGAYLVEGPGHCAECHSPRDALGGILRGRRFSGGPDPEGKGYVPNITPHATGIGSWSKADIADALKSGMTPNYDSLGGSMAAVVRNTSQLSDADRAAMAHYLTMLPAIEAKKPPRKE